MDGNDDVRYALACLHPQESSGKAHLIQKLKLMRSEGGWEDRNSFLNTNGWRDFLAELNKPKSNLTSS